MGRKEERARLYDLHAVDSHHFAMYRHGKMTPIKSLLTYNPLSHSSIFIYWHAGGCNDGEITPPILDASRGLPSRLKVYAIQGPCFHLLSRTITPTGYSNGKAVAI